MLPGGEDPVNVFTVYLYMRAFSICLRTRGEENGRALQYLIVLKTKNILILWRLEMSSLHQTTFLSLLIAEFNSALKRLRKTFMSKCYTSRTDYSSTVSHANSMFKLPLAYLMFIVLAST